MSDNARVCSRCNEERPSDRFSIKTNPNGNEYTRNYCKSCERNPGLATKNKAKTHWCVGCEQEVPIANFTFHRLRRVKVNIKCLDCEPRNIGKTSRAPDPDGTYPCNKCGEVKGFDEFTKLKNRVHVNCRECLYAANAQRYYAKLGRKPEANAAYRPIRDRQTDMRYDFAFARDVLGMSKEWAWAWIGKGYRSEPETIAGYGFHNEADLVWQPDELIDEEVEA